MDHIVKEVQEKGTKTLNKKGEEALTKYIVEEKSFRGLKPDKQEYMEERHLLRQIKNLLGVIAFRD